MKITPYQIRTNPVNQYSLLILNIARVLCLMYTLILKRYRVYINSLDSKGSISPIYLVILHYVLVPYI